ncbi:dynein heavy chain-like protein PF11_0240 isoform X2 [Monomorium pharaonis]|uniref:dynein heavy chain-like protein PF11_0240 isoform X2 n=1 Tax=Monomorium pharaonis TaxID=307658 RepID=UPI001746812C|nr:dynein heavy chain-like protein PF11_0240 isoform X2 [Monomorium pharaonis]
MLIVKIGRLQTIHIFIHFAPDTWEQRIDGKRKLKSNAVPTIFGFFLKKEMSVAKNKNEVLVKNNDANDNMLDKDVVNSENDAVLAKSNDANDNMLNNDVFNDQSIVNKNTDIEFEEITNSSESSSVTDFSKNDEDKKQREHNKFIETINRQHIRMIKMRRKMKSLRTTIHTLQTKISNDKFKVALNSIFNEDQIRALFTKKRSARNWSDETINRALKLKSVCGNNGYEELIRQGYPFPSLRTLRRKLGEFKSDSEVSSKMSESLVDDEPNFETDADFECNLAFHDYTKKLP